MGSEVKAAQAYKISLQVIEQVNGKGTAETVVQTSTLLGRNILHEELGFFGEWEGANYNLTEAEKNRLLAHARQDIASTHSLATDAVKTAMASQKAVDRNRRRLNIVLALQVIIILILLILLVK